MVFFFCFTLPFLLVSLLGGVALYLSEYCASFMLAVFCIVFWSFWAFLYIQSSGCINEHWMPMDFLSSRCI